MIRGILFDKDGTLVDFFSLWLKAALDVTPVFLRENNLDDNAQMTDYVLRAMGVEDGKVDPKGALAYKSYQEIAEDICRALEEKGIVLDTGRVQEQLERLFNGSVTSGDISYRELTDIGQVMRDLKGKGICVGLATADTLYSAESCLKKLGTYQEFDYVGADDGIRKPKPEADMFLEFQNKFHLKPEEIAVVGDTYNDVVFAKNNGGIAIGVLSGVSSEEDFRGEADYILNSIQELPQLLERME